MNIDWPFTSHMVLQRNQTIHFSGSSNYSHIKVQVDEDIYAATVVDKKWCVDLYFEHSGGPFSIIVSDEEETILLEDLYVGDEYEIEGGYVAKKVITRKNSERIIRYAFEYAIKQY